MIGPATVFFAGMFAATPPTPGVQTPQLFEGEVVRRVRLPYLLYLPPDYEPGSDKRWPLLIFLHGAGERGDDLERIKVHGVPKVVEREKEFPFIAVSPQCPRWSWWTAEVEALDALLDSILEQYAVDEDRVYLTGLSMGGFGTWAWAIRSPDRFAAIAPICGGGDPSQVHRIRHLPIWVFHGAKDNVVPLSESERMVEALKALGANVRLTVYPDAGHDSWTVTYDNPELYSWFLQHRRSARATE
ncbi:MAG: hypothetical protein KatS3mg115_2220 [Candidatus Poribacteria bacterium]|nr:MAG: hypothetical protein KatS3mg115_2220 [Candidatus Poribacteria bacterium]